MQPTKPPERRCEKCELPIIPPLRYHEGFRCVELLKQRVQGLEADRERLINVARGCHDYGGGHADTKASEAFHHGIQTVINALEAAANDPASMQVRVLESIGIDAARGAK